MVRNQRDENLIIQGNVGGSGTNGVRVDASHFIANATEAATISNVAPAGVGTATISKWLVILDSGGVHYYVPVWT